MKELKRAEDKTNVKIILGILVFSAFIGVFNETILNVSLNILMEEMSVSAATIQWIVTAYMIVVSVMVPVTAFLIQSFETKKLYLSAMGLILLGTVCAACSVSFWMLLISRMIQALGAGMMIPIMMTTILAVTPKDKIGSAMGIGVCAIQLGPALGPTVSGFLLEYFSWHVLFIILVPFIVVPMILGIKYLLNVSELSKPKLDIISIILSTIGVGGVIYGLSTLSSGGNISTTIIISVIGIVALCIFCTRQIKLKDPMLEIRTFKFPVFSAGVILVMISMMAVFTMNVMLPMFLQGALKCTTFTAALVLLPATLCNGFVTLIGGKIYDKIGAKIMVPTGFAIIGVLFFIVSHFNTHTSIIKIIVTYMIACIGVGCSLSPSQTSSLNELPKEFYPHGVAIMNTLQQIAAAIGSAVFIGIMSASSEKALLNSETVENSISIGFDSAVIALDVLVVIGFLLALFISLKDKKGLYVEEGLKE